MQLYPSSFTAHVPYCGNKITMDFFMTSHRIPVLYLYNLFLLLCATTQPIYATRRVGIPCLPPRSIYRNARSRMLKIHKPEDFMRWEPFTFNNRDEPIDYLQKGAKQNAGYVVYFPQQELTSFLLSKINTKGTGMSQ